MRRSPGNLGEEYGATTGRPRQCNWLDLTRLTRAIKINGVNQVVLNKVDVLRSLGVYRLIKEGAHVGFHSFTEMRQYIEKELDAIDPEIKLYFSERKDAI